MWLALWPARRRCPSPGPHRRRWPRALRRAAQPCRWRPASRRRPRRSSCRRTSASPR
ncbi:hypothetical protein ACFFX0_10010 [Citricoccus parietis]|uniref:Uncharacterized protein n=1 Tax=Citricoccus parietis TaxID=592307 RepID=A0ABV5FXU8_9MICC